MLVSARPLPRFVLTALCAAATHLLAQAPAVLRNLPYTADATGTYHADLYQPATPGPHPVILAIHGGSWRSGHKQQLRHLCADLASAGYACFTIDYDTHPRSFPTSWQESRAALTFLHTHAADYSLDPNRIAVLGTSAGGELAALLALAPEGPANPNAAATPYAQTPTATATTPGPATTPAPAASPELPVTAAILYNGGYDLHPRAYLLRRYLGGTCAQIPAVCNDASPDFHVHPGAPPIFIGHGTHDHMVPYSQATTFISLLQSAHNPVTPYIATGAGHSYWRNRHWYSKNLEATKAFLTQSLPGAASQP